MKFCVLGTAIALSFALSACEGDWGKGFVQGQWYEKACSAGGGHYETSSNGSCRDFSPRKAL
jgi:hypothetical protein